MRYPNKKFSILTLSKFSPDLKRLAQKLGLLRSFEVLDIFVEKSKSEEPGAFKFGAKRVPMKDNNATGKNLVLISQTTFEKFKNEHFVLLIHPQIRRR